MALLEADCLKFVAEELENIIDRLVNDNSLLRSDLPCYARIQNIPPENSPWDSLDKYDYEIVRIMSITPSGDCFFIEYESNNQGEAGKAFIEAEDIRWLKNVVSSQSISTQKVMYGYTDIFQLITPSSCDPKALLGFIIKPDGIWMDILPEDDSKGLHPVELAAYYAPFTSHDVSKPVLSLPCTGKELKQFLLVTGHYCGEDIYVQEEAEPVQNNADKNDTAVISCNAKESQAEIEQKPVQPASEKEHIDFCLEQNKKAPLPERIYYLKTNTKLTANQIGDVLDVSHNTPGCCSRKVTIGKLFKEEALRLGTWEQVKRKNGA